MSIARWGVVNGNRLILIEWTFVIWKDSQRSFTKRSVGTYWFFQATTIIQIIEYVGHFRWYRVSLPNQSWSKKIDHAEGKEGKKDRKNPSSLNDLCMIRLFRMIFFHDLEHVAYDPIRYRQQLRNILIGISLLLSWSPRATFITLPATFEKPFSWPHYRF